MTFVKGTKLGMGLERIAGKGVELERKGSWV